MTYHMTPLLTLLAHVGTEGVTILVVPLPRAVLYPHALLRSVQDGHVVVGLPRSPVQVADGRGDTRPSPVVTSVAERG